VSRLCARIVTGRPRGTASTASRSGWGSPRSLRVARIRTDAAAEDRVGAPVRERVRQVWLAPNSPSCPRHSRTRVGAGTRCPCLLPELDRLTAGGTGAAWPPRPLRTRRPTYWSTWSSRARAPYPDAGAGSRPRGGKLHSHVRAARGLSSTTGDSWSTLSPLAGTRYPSDETAPPCATFQRAGYGPILRDHGCSTPASNAYMTVQRWAQPLRPSTGYCAELATDSGLHQAAPPEQNGWSSASNRTRPLKCAPGASAPRHRTHRRPRP
jgi:hypothetical protein